MSPEEIQQIFFVECEESLAAAEAGLAACKAGVHDADTVNAVFRGVHSIKGGAGAFGHAALQAYTHTFETLLSDVREGTVALDPGLIDLLLRALDLLSDHVDAAREGGQPPEDSAMLAELTAAQAGSARHEPAAHDDRESGSEPEAAEPAGAEFGGGDIDLDSLLADIAGDLGLGLGDAEAEPAPAAWPVHIRPHAGAMRNGSEPLLMLRELANLGGECRHCDVSQVPPLDALDPAQGYLGWTFAMPASVGEEAVRDIFDFIGSDCAIAIGEDAAIPPAEIAAPRVAPSAPPAPAAAATPLAAVRDIFDFIGSDCAIAIGEDAAIPPAEIAAPRVAPSAPLAAVAEPAAARGDAPASAPAPAQSIRIDLAKLDRLIDAVGELVIAQAMMAQRLAGEGVTATEELTLLETLTRDIQESAMAIRAQPIGSVFSRVPRILRELAQSTGKHVRLELSGEATELDKTVIERLGEPLTHLIRNAVDHGIESAEARLAAGKSAEGTLTLAAEHRSGRILIRIADDGQGIDRARVLAKAVERGLVPPEAQLSREEIDNLIFAPGFSTAASVTSVSGRGVGMDVVRQNVKELGGRITIESEEGKGTTFTLTLPLTLAISDGMIVNVGDQTLVVPLAHVVESLRPGPGDIQGIGNHGRVLNVRGRFIPVLPVREAIGGARPSAHEPAHEPAHGGVLIVVDTEAAGQAALLVDDICDQRQFVIKSLDTHYRPVAGVAGATILGDGRVALILDVDGLVANAMTPAERKAAA